MRAESRVGLIVTWDHYSRRRFDADHFFRFSTSDRITLEQSRVDAAGRTDQDRCPQPMSFVVSLNSVETCGWQRFVPLNFAENARMR